MDASDRDRWRRIEALFGEAADLPREDWAGFLDGQVPDPSLRAHVARLLRAHERAGDFLEQLDTDRAAALIRAGTDELDEGDTIGPYRLVRRLGSGGMGVVWLARDPRLDRAVALKLLPPHRSADDAARRRLADEARAASALDHPGIAAIYDVGEAPAGGVFIAMAYYEGESLRRRIERGPLPVDEAVDLAAQIAEGLAAAHAAGIVHCDIKPGNLLITTAGAVKIVDFGVARIPGPARQPGGGTGGTPPYMSPEQVRGDDVDERADVWALGVVLHEMLTGERPFWAADDEALALAILSVEAEPVRATRPGVPRRLAAVVTRCLEKDPAARYAGAVDLAADLRAVRVATWRRSRPVAAGAVLVLMGAAALAALGMPRFTGVPGAGPPPESPAFPDATLPAGTPRVAVLPFAHLGEALEDDYFADGLTEELIAQLSRLEGLRVIARSSVMSYRDPDRDLAGVAAALGVGSVIEGGVRRAGDRLRITVRLVDTGSHETLWSESYDAALVDMLAVQRDIAERVGAALRVRLAARPPPRVRAPVEPEAYTAYLRGRHVLNRRTEHALHQAVRYFQDAIRHDPDFAGARAGLAQALLHLGNYGFLPGHEVFERATREAERAIALDSTTDAHTVLALLRVATLDFTGAEAAFRTAIESMPGDANTRHWYGFFLGMRGQIEEALRQVHVAHELDPLALPVISSLARLLVHAGDPESAVRLLESATELDPRYPWTWYGLAVAHAGAGRDGEAMAALDRALELSPDHPRLVATMVALHARTGQGERARDLLRGLDPDGRRTPAPHFELSIAYAAVGDVDRALAGLERTSWTSEYLFSLRTDPFIAPLRDDPGYERLLVDLGL